MKKFNLSRHHYINGLATLVLAQRRYFLNDRQDAGGGYTMTYWPGMGFNIVPHTGLRAIGEFGGVTLLPAATVDALHARLGDYSRSGVLERLLADEDLMEVLCDLASESIEKAGHAAVWV